MRVGVAALACGLAAAARAPAEEIHDAVRSKDAAWVERLIESNGVEALNARLGDGVTPLHLAAAMDLEAITGLLIDRGADVDARTRGGFMPLHWAAGRDAAAAARLLLAAGADVNVMTPKGVTPLHWAAARNATNVIQVLILAGANVQEQTADGLTPLHWAYMGRAYDAETMLAFKIVSDEMAAEAIRERAEPPREPPLPSEADVMFEALAGARGRSPQPERSAEKPPSEPPSPAVVRRAAGRQLVVDLGVNQTLEFVWLDGLHLWAGKCEVTNGEYRRFKAGHKSLEREKLSLDGEDQPVVRVSWEDAQEYVAWLNKSFVASVPAGCRFRLPYEVEWMIMARCGDNREYPWGSRWPPAYGNFSDLSARKSLADWRGIRGYDDGYAVTCPVAASGANEWGLFGMAGNVWEWCQDWFDETKQHKVRKGGSWDFDQQPSLRVQSRGFGRPDARYDTVGFRLVLSQQE